MKLDIKENPAGLAVYMETNGKVKERNLKAFVQEGYRKNVIIYRCIDEITKALGSVDIEVHDDKGPVENHPALMVLARPNPLESWPQFLRHAFAEYFISGNMFITRSPESGKPAELWVQSSDKMEVHGGPKGMPREYVFKSGGAQIKFPVDQTFGTCSVFHLKTYNPDNPFVGMSTLEPISIAADLHNNGMSWNAALLENSARPSGIMTFDVGSEVSNETAASVKEWFRKKFQGPRNAGEVHVVKGGKWQSMSENAKDMDFLNSMKESAKYIASALGVPLPLIDNDAASYNNMQQAKERLWTDTVLPLLNEFLESLGNWMLPLYGADNLKFAYDIDSIPALEGVRAHRFDRMLRACGAPMLTVDEARSAIGYEIRGGTSDEMLIPSSSIPLGAMDSASPDAVDPLAAPVTDVQATVLNGAQITALQQIVQAVADGMLPGDTAQALISVAFPSLTPDQISKIVKPASDFTPEKALAKSIGLTDEEIKALKYEH